MLYVKFDNFENVSVIGDAKNHGMIISIRYENAYAECERCSFVERIASPCAFIAGSFKQRTNFNEGYEFCDKCL